MYQINDENINQAFQFEMAIFRKLIDLGFKELRDEQDSKIDYFIPFLLLSNGLERFMKCLRCLYYLKKNNKFPDTKIIKTHVLKRDLFDIIIEEFNTNVPFTKEDKSFITQDKILTKFLDILSNFADKQRYLNLDIITNNNQNNTNETNIIVDYSSLKYEILMNDEKLKNKYFDNLNNYSDFTERNSIDKEIRNIIKERIIETLKRFIAILARQYTFGDLSDDAKRIITPFNDYLLYK